MDHNENNRSCEGEEAEREQNEVSSLYERRTSLPRAIQIDFTKASISTYYSSTYEADDEVFIEFEEWQGSSSYSSEQMMSREEEGRRSRRTSDVIDCLGKDLLPENQDSRSRRSTSPDIRDALQHFGSDAPSTPRSDVGYWSGSVPSISSPLEPKWFRYSQSSEGTMSRQGSIRSEKSPRRSLSKEKEESYMCETKVRRATLGGGEMSSTSHRISDTVDAHPIENQPPTTPVRREFEVKMTFAPVLKDSDEYNMCHAKRGVALIFNHENFRSPTLPERKGSQCDVKSLHDLYNALGFDVRIYNDCKIEEIYNILGNVSKENHRDHDCVCVNVLTHGLDGEHLYAFDNPYPYNDLYNFFNASNCLSLAGKPKIFIIQACRGKALDAGVHLIARTTTDSGSPSNSSYTIPSMADFLIANSTFGGYYSWRNPEEGTWYIQSLVNILLEHHNDLDLMTMMTKVARRVATEFESFNDIRPDLSGMKQAPSIVSTLLRQIYFKSKT